MAFGFATGVISEAERIAGQRWHELQQVRVGFNPFLAPGGSPGETWTEVNRRLNVTIATVVPPEVIDEVFDGEIERFAFFGPDGWTGWGDQPPTVSPGARIGIAVGFRNIGNVITNFRVRITGAMDGAGTMPDVPPAEWRGVPFIGTGPTAPGPVLVNVFLDVWVP